MGRILVTGASGSMGFAAVKYLASQGHSVIMACRNLEKGERVLADILTDNPRADLELRQLDLGSFKSIRSFAKGLENVKLDGLFNNAGIIYKDFGVTEDGLEKTFAVNYAGPFLLTKLLLPNLGNDGRVVNMVSLTCKHAKLDRDCLVPDASKFSQLGTYAASKLALMLFSIELAARTGLKVNVADPGVVNSNMLVMHRWYDRIADIIFRPFTSSAEKGVRPALNALESNLSLQLFKGSGHCPIPNRYRKNPLLLTLWEETEKAIA